MIKKLLKLLGFIEDKPVRKYSREEMDEYIRREIDPIEVPVAVDVAPVKDYDGCPIDNIIFDTPYVNKERNWFCVRGITPSPAEQMIADALDKYDIKFYQEVAFSNFRSENGGHYRFDFYIPSLDMCIEYDSKQWHSIGPRMEADRIKTNYCNENAIKLRRYDSTDYYNLEIKIAELMKRNNIRKKAIATG